GTPSRSGEQGRKLLHEDYESSAQFPDISAGSFKVRSLSFFVRSQRALAHEHGREDEPRSSQQMSTNLQMKQVVRKRVTVAGVIIVFGALASGRAESQSMPASPQ